MKWFSVLLLALCACSDPSLSAPDDMDDIQMVDGGVEDAPLDTNTQPLPVASCVLIPNGTPCAIGNWIGTCTNDLCCWSCIANAPTGGACPFADQNGELIGGQCVTGRCFTAWELELQPTTCQ